MDKETQNEKVVETNFKPYCVTMVGMPGCGKSTWVDYFKKRASNVQVLSMDNVLGSILANSSFITGVRHVSVLANERVVTHANGIESRINIDDSDISSTIGYNQPIGYANAFSEYKYELDSALSALALGLRVSNKKNPIVIDSTNLTKRKRALIREVYFPKDMYQHIAVVFKDTTWEQVIAKNTKRQEQNRGIPIGVLEGMYAVYTEEAIGFWETEEAQEYTDIVFPTFQVRMEEDTIFD